MEAGDTLNAIVVEFLPDGVNRGNFQARIIEINDIENPAALSIGQVLQIPRE